MANYEKTQYGTATFLLGNNLSEAGTVTSASAVAKGTVLIRSSGKNWEPATAQTLVSGAGVGIAMADIAAGTAIAADIGIAGVFNRSVLVVDSNALTDAQTDILRGQGIVAAAVTEVRE